MHVAYHFKGWRDRQAMRLPVWGETWTDAQRRAYDAGYNS